jgi:hypothetical protein
MYICCLGAVNCDMNKKFMHYYQLFKQRPTVQALRYQGKKAELHYIYTNRNKCLRLLE